MATAALPSPRVLLCALLLAPAPALGADEVPPAAPAPEEGARREQLERVMQQQLDADAEARESQQRIEALDDETQKLLAEYRKALADTESYAAYAKQLEAQIRSQDEELADVERQLSEIETTSREVFPLMQRMLDTLEQFVALDVPFLREERARRVANLKEMMSRADVTISEKYRRIVEAYQVELDYGRTIEAYDGALAGEGEPRTVQFLRVGRVSLLYQTLDGGETGYWDMRRKTWIVDDAYAHAFKEGVGVARKARAPEMLIVPVPPPAEARS
jgi:Spy/CpxP family protein refolding chaperone